MIGYNHFDFANKAYKIIIDIDPRELIKPTIKPDMPINANVKDVLLAMLEEDYIPERKHLEWLNWCKEKLEKYPTVLKEYYNDGSDLINPYVFVDVLFNRLNKKDKIVCGNGSACVITFQGCKIKQGQRIFTNSGCAAMGYGLPAALGVAVSDNNFRTICIDGDGSIMMNIQELATIVYNKLDIKIFIINNNGYHSIRQTQNNLFKPPYIGIDSDSGICFPDFKILSDAFGIKYLSLSNEKESEQIIESVLASKGPFICEVKVDSKQNFAPKSSSRVLPDGRIVSPSLDDMAPFLDREEYENIKFVR